MAAKAFIALAAAAVGALGAIRQGKADEAAANFEADQLRQQGERDREIATQESADFRNAEARRQASFRARLGGSGVTLEGTPLAVLSDLAAETEFQALRIEAGGNLAANRAGNQANLRRFEGRASNEAAKTRAGTTLLTAASTGSFGSTGTPTGGFAQGAESVGA